MQPVQPRPEPIVIKGRLIEDPAAIEMAPYMDEGRAAFVRQLRREEGCSWRAVAERCSQEWGTDFGLGEARSYQYTGMTLCLLAGAYLGEGGLAGPWL